MGKRVQFSSNFSSNGISLKWWTKAGTSHVFSPRGPVCSHWNHICQLPLVCLFVPSLCQGCLPKALHLCIWSLGNYLFSLSCQRLRQFNTKSQCHDKGQNQMVTMGFCLLSTDLYCPQKIISVPIFFILSEFCNTYLSKLVTELILIWILISFDLNILFL